MILQSQSLSQIYNRTAATLCVLAAILFVCHVAIKYQYGFWYYQPVQHTWRYLRPWRWSSAPTVYRPQLPTADTAAPGTLVLNPKILNTTYADLIDDTQWGKLTHFIGANYLNRADGNVYSPTIQNIRPYFVGHNDPCFISFYRPAIAEDELAGVMTSRPLLATFYTTENITNEIRLPTNEIRLPTNEIRLYYVDFLCVGAPWRRQGIASKLIQTHEYHQRHKNREIQVSLFKHETDILKGVIPLVAYSTYGFRLDSGTIAPPQPLPPYKMSTLTVANLPTFMDFLKTVRPQYRIFIAPAIANVSELITTQNLYIHTVIDMNTKTPVAAYFYKNTCVQWDTHTKVLMMTASAHTDDTPQDLFIHGFLCSHYAIRKKHPEYGICAIEDIGANTQIAHYLLNDVGLPPIVTSPTAYFFYNYYHPCVATHDAFILT